MGAPPPPQPKKRFFLPLKRGGGGGAKGTKEAKIKISQHTVRSMCWYQYKNMYILSTKYCSPEDSMLTKLAPYL